MLAAGGGGVAFFVAFLVVFLVAFFVAAFFFTAMRRILDKSNLDRPRGPIPP
jgi:hypothetical protein